MHELTKSQKRRALLGLAVVLGLFMTDLICPGTYEAAPALSVRVSGSDGQAISGAIVTQTYSYYFGAHWVEHRSQEDFTTDINGQVLIPKRLIHNSRLSVWTGRLTGMLNVHSSFGPNSTVYISKSGYDRVSGWVAPTLPLVNGVRQMEFVMRKEQRPATLSDAIQTGDLRALKRELQREPYYAEAMQGVILINDVIRSPAVTGSNGVEMVQEILEHLGKPNRREAYKAYGPGFGIAPYIQFRDKDNLTALQRAILLGKFEIAEYLLSIGVMPNPDAVWQTPATPSALHLAVKAGNSKLVESLLANNADPNAKDQEGNTPLELARKIGNEEVVRILARSR